MKTKNLLTLLLVLCLVVSCFAGCAKDSEGTNVVNTEAKETTPVTSKPVETEPTAASGNEDPEEPQPTEPQEESQPANSLLLEQIGVVKKSSFTACKGGLLYKDKDTQKYGILSSDGAVDSGAVYAVVDTEDVYFAVMSKKPANENDIAGLNTTALVDGNGRQIIAPQYAAYSVDGDFITACKAVAKSDDGRLYVSSGSDLFETPNAEMVEYKCTYDLYNAITGAKLREGSENGYSYAEGGWIRERVDNDYVYFDANGNTLTGVEDVFKDGSYSVEGQIGEVFASDGTKLLGYDLNGYVPYEKEGDYYVAKRYMDGKSTYVVMDMAGKVISTEFDQLIQIYGNMVRYEKTLRDFQGNLLMEGECGSVYRDTMFGQYYIAYSNDAQVLLDENGNEYLRMDGTNANAYTDDFVFYDKSSGKKMFYCHATGQYDIEGTSCSPWLVRADDANYTYKLIDTITGEVLMSAYSGYTSVERDDTSYYLYAKYNGGAIAYLVTSTDGFKTVTDKKNNLMDDLANAFQAEGITVTVNRATGEIRMDSSVLFGGDSAELTADGKDFLNRFIKAYNSVAFSSKYEGFISRTMIEGHTAPVAGTSYASDLPLSQDRANNVKNYILSGETGVDLSGNPNAFEAIGYSNSQPVYKEDGTVDMDASRRVSFRFLVNVNGIS